MAKAKGRLRGKTPKLSPRHEVHLVGLPTCLPHVLGRAPVDDKLLAVEREPAGAVALAADRHDAGRADQDVVDVATDPTSPVAQRHRVQHPPARRPAPASDPTATAQCARRAPRPPRPRRPYRPPRPIRQGRYTPRVTHPSDLEARLTVLEARMEEVAADAARHLAAARDRDLADLGVKVDANRSAINALGVQTAGRFDRLDQQVDRLEEKVIPVSPRCAASSTKPPPGSSRSSSCSPASFPGRATSRPTPLVCDAGCRCVPVASGP